MRDRIVAELQPKLITVVFKAGDPVLVISEDGPRFLVTIVELYPPGCALHGCRAWVVRFGTGAQGVFCERHLALPNMH